MVGDLERHLQGDPLIIVAVRNRGWGTIIPDQQTLPYILLELTGETSQRTSGHSIVKGIVKVTAFAVTSAEAERIARLASNRLTKVPFNSSEPGVIFLDVNDTNRVLSPVPY